MSNLLVLFGYLLATLVVVTDSSLLSVRRRHTFCQRVLLIIALTRVLEISSPSGK